MKLKLKSETIIGMAQNFVGTNNINLLDPVGEFGTRDKGGKDASASRYIFTKLTTLTRIIFNKYDDSILNYLDDDGLKIEPEFYVPIIPMVLVNGADGIGTGWSTFVPKYKPEDIITYIENKLKRKRKNIELNPWYKDYKGSFTFDKETNKFITRGIIKRTVNKRIKDKIYQISELPIGTNNDSYHTILDKLMEKDEIVDYDDNSIDSSININVRITKKFDNIYNNMKLLKNFLISD